MKTVKFLIWTLIPIESEYEGLEDIISVNGVVCRLDFVNKDTVGIVDKKEAFYRIAKKDIHSIVKYSNFIEGNMSSVAIKELIAA
ncbi:hypothetical protein [uncultured Bacteroides sp.]|uniref:hypothetical protein n=1 Tax=uncultured Bacteroides sp. TaxID=162156 RepID=UPI0025D70239|nr:hypothetical protein [uncultured Bacteroides sp.]